MAFGADLLGRFDVDQLLEHELDESTNEIQIGSFAKRLEQLGCVNI